MKEYTYSICPNWFLKASLQPSKWSCDDTFLFLKSWYGRLSKMHLIVLAFPSQFTMPHTSCPKTEFKSMTELILLHLSEVRSPSLNVTHTSTDLIEDFPDFTFSSVLLPSLLSSSSQVEFPWNSDLFEHRVPFYWTGSSSLASLELLTLVGAHLIRFGGSFDLVNATPY